MKIISVWSRKGGVGKTMLAVNIAAGLVEAGRKTLVVDLDPQANFGSSLTVFGLSQGTADELPFKVVSASKDQPVKLDAEFDYMVVDHPSGTDYVPGEGQAHLVVMPFQSCVLDYQAWRESVVMLPEDLPVLPVLNRVNVSRAADKEVVEVMRDKKPAPFVIRERSIYPRMIGEGQSVLTSGTRYGGREAREEIEELVQKIMEEVAK